jgi:hypothetical protein
MVKGLGFRILEKTDQAPLAKLTTVMLRKAPIKAITKPVQQKR